MLSWEVDDVLPFFHGDSSDSIWGWVSGSILVCEQQLSQEQLEAAVTGFQPFSCLSAPCPSCWPLVQNLHPYPTGGQRAGRAASWHDGSTYTTACLGFYWLCVLFGQAPWQRLSSNLCVILSRHQHHFLRSHHWCLSGQSQTMRVSSEASNTSLMTWGFFSLPVPACLLPPGSRLPVPSPHQWLYLSPCAQSAPLCGWATWQELPSQVLALEKTASVIVCRGKHCCLLLVVFFGVGALPKWATLWQSGDVLHWGGYDRIFVTRCSC